MVAIMLLFGIAGAATAADAGTLSAADYLNPENWINLKGFRYTGQNTTMPEGEYLPAELTFSDDETGIGINYQGKGYYKNGEYDFAGAVFGQKIDVKTFSATIAINKLGGNASISEDGWIAIALMQKPDMFMSLDPTYNSGAVFLLRTGNREINAT